MGEFFKGWRRKIGCVTLVVALLTMAAWIRGLGIHDAFTFGLDDQTRSNPEYTCLQLIAGDGLKLRRFEIKNANIGLSNGWKTYRSDRDVFHVSQGKTKRRWQSFGFGAEETTFANNHVRAIVWVIPYWSLVLPLTLLSALLLLIKPRPSTPKKLTEPICETET